MGIQADTAGYIEDYSRIQRSQKDIGSTGDLQIADLFDRIYNAIIVDD